MVKYQLSLYSVVSVCLLQSYSRLLTIGTYMYRNDNKMGTSSLCTHESETGDTSWRSEEGCPSVPSLVWSYAETSVRQLVLSLSWVLRDSVRITQVTHFEGSVYSVRKKEPLLSLPRGSLTFTRRVRNKRFLKLLNLLVKGDYEKCNSDLYTEPTGSWLGRKRTTGLY